MDAKLKSLKVVDLKQILSKAGVSAPAKANKSDLISKILASQEAIDAYNAQYPSETPNDDLLAPPEDLDWNADEVPSSKVEEPAKPAAEPPQPTIEPEKAADTTESATTTEDAELEKRRQRAARFGIPLVESKPKRTPAAAKKTAPPNDNPDKLKARADRFGTKSPAAGETSPGSKRKRASLPAVEVDPEELERRRKRAERFGASLKPVVSFGSFC
ncbi:hypothetical protein BT96DRAFT_817734 [Gymnopus androsaceus JB14]|uniref:Uncharacterized protein n=1 Tax=Gymnopus androsaceus JB14 TaxID=1447944 RepID=A0A6A4HXM8_9AGAR|nr:hypothetical protein BT96DRAFT_817734 [Gymnopus androsaceus JB14]